MSETLKTEYVRVTNPQIEYCVRPLSINANESEIFNLLTQMGVRGWDHYMTKDGYRDNLYLFKRTVIMEKVEPPKPPRKPRAKKEA